MSKDQKPSPLLGGLRMKCPACQKGPLFNGFLTLRSACPSCDQDFTALDTGEGPAVFIMLIASTLVLVPAFIVEFKYSPPFWVYAVTALPALIGLCLGLLRPFKGVMIALQFYYKASDGMSESVSEEEET